MIKRAAVRVAGSAPFAWAVAAIEKVDRERPALLRVLTYHRVDVPQARPMLSPALLSATPQDFAAQMQVVASRYAPVSMQQVLDVLERGVPLPPRAVLVTFDDAYCDFEEHAWPILQRHHIPVTLFVPTAYPDHPRRRLWWDQLYEVLSSTTQSVVETPVGRLPLTTPTARRRAFKRLRDYVKSLPHAQALDWVDSVSEQLRITPSADNHILGWERLRRLAGQGVTLCPHTETHPLLNRMSVDEARREALASWRTLEDRIGPILPVFAYPGGGFTPELARALRADGFRLGFTTARGLNDLRADDPMLLRRINVGRSTSLGLLRAQLVPSMRRVERLQRARRP